MRPELLHFKGEVVPDLAIFLVDTGNGTHTGMLYRFQGILHIVDQMWHERTRMGPVKPEPGYDYVRPALLPEEETDVTSSLHLIVTRSKTRAGPQQFAYSFSQPSGPQINGAGEIIFGGGVGFTCATFVLAIMEASGVPFVDLTGWLPRAEDQGRHQMLLDMMNSSVPRSHIEKVQAELPCIRVRPEEVAAAGLFDERPVGFEKAERFGKWILESIRAGEPVPIPPEEHEAG